MPSRRSRALGAATLLLLASSGFLGCGVLGGKDDPGLTLDVPTALNGCMDKAGERLTDYLNGSIDPDRWKQVWNCTNDSLTTLNKYGGALGAYTQENVRSLIQTLVITDQKLPADFVPAIFELKASLIGGSKELLTIAEVEQIMQVIEVIRDESVKLLPLLKNRTKDGGPANQLAFSRAVTIANARVGMAFPKAGADSLPLSRGTARTLFRDAATILKWNIPAYLTDVLFAAKVALMGGSPEAIEAEHWQAGFGILGSVAAPGVAMLTVDRDKIRGPNGYGEFLVTVASDLESALEKVIEKRGGMIPSVDVDRLLDALPEHFIPINLSKPTLLHGVRVVTSKFLGSVEAGAIDKPSLQRALQILGRWQKGKTYIDSIYGQSRLSESASSQADLLAAINLYKATAPNANQADLDRLATIVTSYRPLFMGEDDGELSLSLESQYTKNHLTQMHWINLVAELAIQAYSSSADRRSANLQDFENLYADIRDLGSELDIFDPTIPTFARDRFNEADFYMPGSDGNGVMSIEDATYYIAYVKSVGDHSHRMRDDFEEACKISDTRGPMGWKPQDPACFRSHYFSNVGKYWNHAPAMVAYFSTLDPGELLAMESDFEQVARYKGYSQEPMTGFDAKAFPAALHYIETLMNRFDRNGDGRFNTDEAVESSQVFTSRIAVTAGLDPGTDRDKLEAIYTYVVKKGEQPAPNAIGTLQIATWLLARPLWNIDAPRRDLYRALAVFQTASLHSE